MKKRWQQNQMKISEWAQFKRLTEYYSADPEFRRAFCEDAAKVIAEMGFTLEPEPAKEAVLLKYRWNLDPQCVRANPYYSEFIRRNQKISEIVQQKSAPERFADAKMRAWNQLVTRRLRMENRDLRLHPNIKYYPISFELGDGCRVQCPFCGVAASKWKENFLYTEENRKLWREVLAAAKEMTGEIASMGMCYFATEPLDNPDYEKFLQDYVEIMGDCPQTTTSVADKYPDRIRALTAQIGPKHMAQAAVRFSVRTLPQFYRIMEAYDPEELRDIEILMNNPESDCCYSASGRVREHMEDYPKEKLNLRYSISCIAGFKVNMVKKTVTFMEPEIPDEQFPNGIREYETRTFADAQELKRVLEELSDKWIFAELPSDILLRWNPYITIRQEENGVVFEGDHIRCKLGGNQYFYDSIALIERGISFGELCRELKIGDFIAEGLKGKLNILYQKGYLRLLCNGN